MTYEEDERAHQEDENRVLERELRKLQQACHLDFLSDIHSPRYHKEILHYLNELDINKFSLAIWKKIIQYFRNEEVVIESIEEVKAYLKEERKKM